MAGFNPRPRVSAGATGSVGKDIQLEILFQSSPTRERGRNTAGNLFTYIGSLFQSSPTRERGRNVPRAVLPIKSMAVSILAHA